MNPILTQLRTYVDQIDNTLRKIDAEIDTVENLPFIGAVVKPFGTTIDEVLALADNIRSAVDQLAPIVPPAPVPKK